MTHTPCWNCRQPATHVLTREGSITLHACDNCTRIDRAEAERLGWTITPSTTEIDMNTDPKTVGTLVHETSIVANSKQLTVNTVLIDAASSSYNTTIFDDSVDKRHHGMRLGTDWIIGRGQQMGTRGAAIALHEEAVEAALNEEPWPIA
jgi:hypothetical protein